MKGRVNGGPTLTLRRVICVMALAVAALLAVRPAAADVFVLEDGRRIEGSVIRELGSLLSIRTSEGIVTIDRREIRRHEETRTVYDEYLARNGALSDRDVPGHIALARWCTEQGLETEATLHYKIAVQIDPNNEVARAALGYEWIAGDWYLRGSPEAAARRRELERPVAAEAHPIRAREKVPAIAPSLAQALPRVPGGRRVLLELSERVGRGEPPQPYAGYRLGKLFEKLKEPMQIVLGSGAHVDYLLSVRIRVYFVKTRRFYTAPIYHEYRGEAQLTLSDAKTNEVVAEVRKLVTPFTASVQLDKGKALQFAYYDTVRNLEQRLRQHPFFRKLGAEAAIR